LLLSLSCLANFIFVGANSVTGSGRQAREPRAAALGEVLPPLASRQLEQHVGHGRVGPGRLGAAAHPCAAGTFTVRIVYVSSDSRRRREGRGDITASATAATKAAATTTAAIVSTTATTSAVPKSKSSAFLRAPAGRAAEVLIAMGVVRDGADSVGIDMMPYWPHPTV
jgi:hypothetical protein